MHCLIRDDIHKKTSYLVTLALPLLPPPPSPLAVPKNYNDNWFSKNDHPRALLVLVSVRPPPCIGKADVPIYEVFLWMASPCTPYQKVPSNACFQSPYIFYFPF